MPVTLSHAESVPLPLAAPRLNPLVLWHVLSLDAPTVATVWTLFAAHALHVPLAPAIPIAMFLAVWIIYATDRLLDAGLLSARLLDANAKLEPRHHFHHRHRCAFTAAIVAVTLALIPITLEIPPPILHRYLVLAALLAVWFALIHTVAKPLPKELALGPFFSAAVFIPVWSMHVVSSAFFFALLCSLNCLYIYAWEHPTRNGAHPATNRATSIALRLLTPLTLLALALPIAPILFATALAASLLLTLDRFRARFDATTLRAAADLVLLTPLLIAPFVK